MFWQTEHAWSWAHGDRVSDESQEAGTGVQEMGLAMGLSFRAWRRQSRPRRQLGSGQQQMTEAHPRGLREESILGRVVVGM